MIGYMGSIQCSTMCQHLASSWQAEKGSTYVDTTTSTLKSSRQYHPQITDKHGDSNKFGQNLTTRQHRLSAHAS